MITASCRSCGAAIIWAVTPNGRPIPIDAEPLAGGNIELAPGPTTSPIATVVKAPLERGHRAHFVSCPNAAAHRRGPR